MFKSIFYPSFVIHCFDSHPIDTQLTVLSLNMVSITGLLATRNTFSCGVVKVLTHPKCVGKGFPLATIFASVAGIADSGDLNLSPSGQNSLAVLTNVCSGGDMRSLYLLRALKCGDYERISVVLLQVA